MTNKKYIGLAGVALYFITHVSLETGYLVSILKSINDDLSFWKNYLDIMLYVFFAIVFLSIYCKELIDYIRSMKKEYGKTIVSTVIFIIATMVISAIILSYCGVGESENEEFVSEAMTKNTCITSIIVVVLGPFVEEMVFRKNIYLLIRGEKSNFYRCICAVVFTSLIFAVYHCSIKDLINGDVIQLLSVIPLFFLGVGLAYVQEKTSNILCPIIVHMVINLIALS